MGSGLKRTPLCRGGLAIGEEGFDNRHGFLEENIPGTILGRHIEGMVTFRQKYLEGKFSWVAKFQKIAAFTGDERKKFFAAAGVHPNHVTVFDGTDSRLA